MTTFTDTVGSQPAPADPASGEGASPSSFPRLCEEFESLSSPNRGLVLGVLASSLFWIALILAVGLLRLMLR